MTEPKPLTLALPDQAPGRERLSFHRLCRLLSMGQPTGPDGTSFPTLTHEWWIENAGIGDLYDQPHLAAAAHVAIDLVDQGWTLVVTKNGGLFMPPLSNGNLDQEKQRIRRQELVRRDEQLRRSSVRKFISRMEGSHLFKGQNISIYDLMRDGSEFAQSFAGSTYDDGVMKPYVEIVDGSNCKLTGLKLHDIWRYFRHTWVNPYSTIPGRSMPILVRDAATPYHAVIGLAAISSPVVQIAERDRWIRWETDQFIDETIADPTLKVARWLGARIDKGLTEVYVEDILRDGVIDPTDLREPNSDAIARLRVDAERYRRRHQGSSVLRQVRGIEKDSWVERAETFLFRYKRAVALADLLEAQLVVRPHLGSRPSAKGLSSALADPRSKAQIRKLIRRARGERVGTVIADLTVCGAIAPYNALAAGKLIGALAVSPPVLRAYREKYSRPSEIASAMAGRSILREPRLSFVGTTSLYGTGSSQYNRLFWPASVMGGETNHRMGFIKMGRSRSFGSSHFSDETVKALVRLSSLDGHSARVNSLFGEGVSPRMRKVRIGLATLGWPADDLLKHGRERILYGVPLVKNFRDYSLGIDSDPQYLLDIDLQDSEDRVSRWWFDRWAIRRAGQAHVIETMKLNSTIRPVRHGARVPLPEVEEEMM